MENSRTRGFCKINHHQASFAKHLRSRKNLWKVENKTI